MIRFSNLIENNIYLGNDDNNNQNLSPNPYAAQIINGNSINQNSNNQAKNYTSSIKDRSAAPNALEKPKKKISNFSIKVNSFNELLNNNRKIMIDLELLNANIFNQSEKNKINIIKNGEKKKRGRKRIRSKSNNNKKHIESKNEHNKFSDDNICRKVKHLVLKCLQEFLNNQIKNIYQGQIGKGVFIKELKTIKQSQISDSTIKFNKKFLSKTLGEIFSENISGRFTNFPANHNKLLIQKLINEEDEQKKNYFKKLFNLEFINCLKHFRGDIFIDELNGLKCFDDIKSEIIDKYQEDGADYYQALKTHLIKFEEIIGKKKSRNIKKNDK